MRIVPSSVYFFVSLWGCGWWAWSSPLLLTVITPPVRAFVDVVVVAPSRGPQPRRATCHPDHDRGDRQYYGGFNYGTAPQGRQTTAMRRRRRGAVAPLLLFMSSSSAPLSVEKSQQTNQKLGDDDDDDGDAVARVATAEGVAEQYRRDAARIRNEADALEVALTLRKIQTLQAQLNSRQTYWAKHPDQRDDLQQELEQLQQRRRPPREEAEATPISQGSPPPPSSNSVTADNGKPLSSKSKASQTTTVTSTTTTTTTTTTTQSTLTSTSTTLSDLSPPNAVSDYRSRTETMVNPLNGFDPEDLQLYIPIARDIESSMPNATMNEQLQAFQSTPQLQQHFAIKLQELWQEPLQDMQRLDELKQQYWQSTSDVEKQQLKRDIQQLERTIDRDGLFEYSDSIYLDRLYDLTADELCERRSAVAQLPPLLQTLYKRRCGVVENDANRNDDDDRTLELAILLEHYEPQLDLLEQVHELTPLTVEQQDETRRALQRLPSLVRRHWALEELGLDEYAENDDTDPNHTRLVQALVQRNGASLTDSNDTDAEETWSNLKGLMMDAATGTSADAIVRASSLSDLNDLDFVDRSRYVDEFYPCVARLEAQRPPQQFADDFCARILDNKQSRIYMVRSRPERVVGGYYIRGENQISNDDSGQKLVHRIQTALRDDPELHNKLEFFYIPDPAPLSDEKVELGYSEQPLILLTAKNREIFYDNSEPLIKLAISALGICSTFLFALGASVLQPTAQDRIQAALDSETSLDLSWLAGNVATVGGSFLAILLAHEVAHRVVAWSNKFDVGLPCVVPSVQLGITGTITPLKSPPPSLHALFDFAMAGPMAGILASIGFLVAGLGITAASDAAQAADLPALPLYLLRTSTLGGDMIELFLGKGTLMHALPSDTVLPLHPFAVAGFTGLLVNALALLPLGHTDGGRVALTMFGRRGAYVVTGFTHILLCLVGLFGFDQAGIILIYNLYAVIWQRKLETPSRNEVEELDLGRGAFGIGAALLVALVLTPML